MKFEGNELIFDCTGSRHYAFSGIIGLADSEEPLSPFYGEDGGLSECFTKEEREELADYMIALWQRYKAEPAQPSPEPYELPAPPEPPPPLPEGVPSVSELIGAWSVHGQ